MKCIVYRQENGVLAIVTLIDNNNIEKDAPKHVPKGFKYKIIDNSELPTDLKYRDAWTIDDEYLTDGVGIAK